MREKVEKVLNEKVRPQLELHNGDLDVLDIEDGVVRIRLLGQCAGCPSAYLTIEQLIFGELTVAIPEIRQVIVVQDVSDELWEEARAVMQGKYENHSARSTLLRWLQSQLSTRSQCPRVAKKVPTSATVKF